MSEQPTVGIVGGTIWGNRGAEAMLVTTIGEVRTRYPDARIIVFSYLPSRDRQLITDKTITVLDGRPRALVLAHFPFALLCWLFGLMRVQLPDSIAPRGVKALRSCDVLLDISGIAFADGREKFLPFNIMIIWPAMLLSVPVVKLAQAVGPFKNPLNRIASSLFLKRCTKVYARGRTTADHLEVLKLPSNKWALSADIAFLYKSEYSQSSENEDRVAALEAKLEAVKAEGKQIIGLSPSSLVYEKSAKAGTDYVARFFRVIRALDPEYHYVLLPNATREGVDKPRNNDLFVIDLLYSRAERELPWGSLNRIHTIDFDLNTTGSRRLIAQCDVVITSRFHGMISCLSLGVPVIVIGWSHKYAEVLAEFDLDRFALDFDDPDMDIATPVTDLIENGPAYRSQITSVLDSVRATSAQQFDDLEHILR